MTLVSYSKNSKPHGFRKKVAFNLGLVLGMTSLMFVGCHQTKEVYTLPALATESSINAVIEIPAGTNKKYEYNTLSKSFEVDIEGGKDRIIDFLPYPANYGFVPSTMVKSDDGGDGDALDIMILAEALPQGAVIESIPIGFLKLLDNGEKDYKVIAVPKDKSLRIIQATTLDELTTEYGAILKIIELWFANYNKKDVSVVQGWGDELEAMQEIKNTIKN